MKTTNFKSAAISLQLLFFCFILFQTANAQKGDMVLNFSGKDAVTSNLVPLESVKVSNETQGGDTTLFGAAPSLSLQWASGIFEQNRGQKASFILEPNYPNPFTENTTVNILLRKPQHLIITLYDQQGAAAANLEQDFGFGTHRFEITVPQNRLCLLTVNDGITTKTLKMFSTSGKNYRVKYLGTDENSGYKSETETAAFVFQPGDVLKFTVNAVGYHEYITYDNPVASMNYVFSLQPNTTELPPTVTTASVTNITATTATCGGNVSDEGSAAVTARGVCWNTAPGATITNSFTMDGAGTGAFTSAIIGLTENTTYFVRAYATNQFGTAYGNEMSFISAQALPTVTTVIVTNISSTSATSGGNVTDEGSAAVTVRGVCWNTSQNPTIANSFTANGSGLGSFTSNITSLIGSTSYYVRAYATNQFGTTYGNEVSFTTATLEPFYACDSTITYSNQYGIEKAIYTRDVTGKPLKVVYKDLNTTYGVWVNDLQAVYTYNAQGKQISRIEQNWDTNIGNWVNSTQYLYSHDAQGNRLSYVNQDWNTEIGVWVNDWQELYTYDAQANQLSYVDQYWSTVIGSWVNDCQYLYTYDSQGNRLSYVNQDWNTEIGSWVNDWQYLYTYDAQGNKLSYVNQYWNTEIGSWVNNWQELYTYDAQGNRLSSVNRDWNTEIGNWVNDWQSLYNYDAQGNWLSYVYQHWNTEIGSWVNNWQELYTYDAQGNRLSYLSQWWNTEIGSWVNSSQYLYTYDAERNILLELYQDWYVIYGTWVNVNKFENQYDYTTRKITTMYFEWSGAWEPVDIYGSMGFTFYNYWLINLYDFYKAELWYNSYQGLATKRFLELPDESFYLNHPNTENFDISTGNLTRTDVSARINPKTKIHEKEVWLDNGLSKSPANNQLLRNKPIQPESPENFHSK